MTAAAPGAGGANAPTLFEHGVRRPVGDNNPVYIRLVRVSLITQPREAVPDYDAHIADVVFLRDKESAGHYSIFRVTSDDDFRFAITGLQSTRPGDPARKFTDPICFVWFTEEDLRATGAAVEPTPGETRCGAANRLHYEYRASEPQALAATGIITSSNRGRVMDVRKPTLRALIAQRHSERCGAVQPEQPSRCHLPICAPAPQETSLASG